MSSVRRLDSKLNPDPLLLQPTGVPREVQVQGSPDFLRTACLSGLLWGGANARTREGAHLPTGTEVSFKVEAWQLSSQGTGS